MRNPIYCKCPKCGQIGHQEERVRRDTKGKIKRIELRCVHEISKTPRIRKVCKIGILTTAKELGVEQLEKQLLKQYGRK